MSFLIYLLETGICLTLLYLAYWLFLRKETYFNFNRVFLVGSIILALAVPLLHFSINITQGSSLERPAKGVLKFRQGYGELLRYLDADFGTEPGSKHMAGGGRLAEGRDVGGVNPTDSKHGTYVGLAEVKTDRSPSWKDPHITISGILFIIYIGGVLYFFARFSYLVIRLYLLAKRNRVSLQDGFRMVEIEEEISPFSFFRFLFINSRSFTKSELDHVLEHEKAHIRHRHSSDHLFAHGLAVFQWFNPFAWQMRKALKTTHEYIADRQVMDRGFERIDYQALLLKQVIGYHSVELVNNFNLKPIKQRIVMMNKTKSGLPAKLKAILVAPIAILIFFLFADFTLKGSSVITDPIKELSGLWIKQSNDDFSEKIFIKEGVFSFPDGSEIRQYDIRTSEDGVIILRGQGGGSPMKYKLSGDELIFSWNPWSESRYIRSKADNTLDQLLLDNKLEIELPYISRYRLFEKEKKIYRIGIALDREGKALYTVNGKTTALPDISIEVNSVLGEKSLLDAHEATGVFLVDRRVPMSEVLKAREELLEAARFHVGEGGYPHGDIELSPLLYHCVALPRLLPPKNAKILDKEEVEKKGGKVYTIDLSARNTSPEDVEMGIEQFIRSTGNNRYIISLEYDDEVPYGQYIETVDMIYNVVYSFRISLAEEKYGAPYDKLGDDLQRELRKVYPMALSESLKTK
jgi:BlaR1 peptidase M56